MKAAGVGGPLLVSVGRADQLAKFLELNPELAGMAAAVDDTKTFEAYRAAGLGMLGDTKLETPPDFKPPTSMGPGKWFKYMANTVGLAPIPKDADFKFGDVPEGVRVLGGTYVLDGDEVVFSHQDAVPGATPEIGAVLAAAGM